MALDKIPNNEPPQIPVETLDPELTLLRAALADGEAYKEEQNRLRSGVTAKVLQIQGIVKTQPKQGLNYAGEGVQMGTEPLSDAYMTVLDKAANTGDLEVQMGTEPLSDAYMAKLNNIA